MPLWKYSDANESEICGGCPLLATKPEAAPERLIPFIATALELSEIREIGGRFQYPDGLSVVEWQCLKALQRGQAKAKQLSDQRDAKRNKK